MKFLTTKKLIAAAVLSCLTISSTLAENIKIETSNSVAQATEKLEMAIKKAGARVFTAVDYQKGAASVGEDIRPTKVVIFGSPKIGADAFKVGQTIGLYLPLRVLAYEDEAGKKWLMYNDPADAATKHGIPTDHPAIKSMQGALKKLTLVAAN